MTSVPFRKSPHTKTSAPKLDFYRPDYDSDRWPLSASAVGQTVIVAQKRTYFTEGDRMQVVPADHKEKILLKIIIKAAGSETCRRLVIWTYAIRVPAKTILPHRVMQTTH